MTGGAKGDAVAVVACRASRRYCRRGSGGEEAEKRKRRSRRRTRRNGRDKNQAASALTMGPNLLHSSSVGVA